MTNTLEKKAAQFGVSEFVLIRMLFNYDPMTGKLYWRVRPMWMFTDGAHSAVHNMRAFNGGNAGKEAFTAVKIGYKVGRIFDKPYRAHRVIFFWVTGAWPQNEIDHIDHDRSNNVWSNIREVTHLVNGKNLSKHSNNKSGFNGVCWRKDLQKWEVYIKIKYKRIYLGVFTHKADAIAARQHANIKYNFHKNHGAAA